MVIDQRAHAWGLFTRDRLVRVARTGGARTSTGAAASDTFPLSSAGTGGHTAYAVLEDREGSIWVATEKGVNQLRLPKITATVWSRPDEVPVIAAADAGALWAVGFYDGSVLVREHERTRATLPTGLTAAHRDLVGQLWVGGVPGLWHARDGRFAPVPLPDALQGGI